MTTSRPIGEILREMPTRAGLSYDEIAKRAGYGGRSSVQRYFDGTYSAEYLPVKVAAKLAKAFIGTSVEPGEIFALTGGAELRALPEFHAEDSLGPQHWSPADETLEQLLRAALPALSASRVTEEILQAVSHEIADVLRTLAIDPSRERHSGVMETLVDGVALGLGLPPPSRDRPAPSTPDRKHHNS